MNQIYKVDNQYNSKQYYQQRQYYPYKIIFIFINKQQTFILQLIKINKIIISHQSSLHQTTHPSSLPILFMHLSPLNNSLSKQLYSFNKAQRFPKTNLSPCKQRFYNYKLNTITNRSTSFGYGNKIDLANKQQVPQPGKYQKNSIFTLNSNQKRGYSFSRHSKRSIINQEQTIKVPGPGKYQTDKDLKFSHLKYSFRSKFQSIFQKTQHNLGPGQYRTLQVINREGRHNLSKFEDSKSRRFSQSPRFQQTRAKTPGPGTYQDDKKLALNKTGSYFTSRFRNNTSNVFGKSERPSLGQRTVSPGPGKYDYFSQFNSKFQA